MVEGVDMTRILVVEDNQDTLDLYEILFQQLNYTSVVYAKDGEAAVNHFETTEKMDFPEIILMDYKMPRKDGLTAAKEILAIDSKAVIVFISDFPEIADEAVKLGALMVSSKPINKILMKEMVDTALHARSLRSST
ncbi:MAG: response regulator [Candidatus Thorarchaeota archaeon]